MLKDSGQSRGVKGTVCVMEKFFQREELCFQVTLRKSHYKDQINGDETEQITHDHSVNHHNKRTDRFETSAEK